MTLYATLKEKDVEIIAWLLQTKSKTHMHVFLKACLLSIIVTGVFVYDVCFYKMRTTPQWVTLIDYSKIAKKRTKPLLNKTIGYTFSEENIVCENGNKREKLLWKDIKEWGMHEGYLFVILQSNDAFIFDQSQYGYEQMLQFKELLARKLGQDS